MWICVNTRVFASPGFKGTHRVEIEGLTVQNIADQSFLSLSTGYFVEPSTPASRIMRPR